MQVVTRFAPSPTGYLHIGGARTALFNWLYARARGGKFLLRIEDTDRERSTPEATQAIFDGLSWLGLDHDGDAISQFERADRHRAVAQEMLASGKAYKCFATQEEISAFRETAKAEGRSTLFLSPWRDVNPGDHPDAPYVVRLRAPRDGQSVIEDEVQGTVRIQNAQLDDMVLLRSDGTPVYMLAVVVDDRDMGVTHVIRGDDHLNNAARQMQIYHAMGWDLPRYAHIPLIHGPDGKKLSKRHGALSVTQYRDMGYPAAAMRNYLARLGWSHGDNEVFTDQEAQQWFDLDGINKAPARLDFKKLDHVSSKHIAMMQSDALAAALHEYMRAKQHSEPTSELWQRFLRAIPVLQSRAKTLGELLDKGAFALAVRPLEFDDKALVALQSFSQDAWDQLTLHLQNATWTQDGLDAATSALLSSLGLNFGKLAAPLRPALSGRTVTPSVIEMMIVLGKEESLGRITDATQKRTS